MKITWELFEIMKGLQNMLYFPLRNVLTSKKKPLAEWF